MMFVVNLAQFQTDEIDSSGITKINCRKLKIKQLNRIKKSVDTTKLFLCQNMQRNMFIQISITKNFTL